MSQLNAFKIGGVLLTIAVGPSSFAAKPNPAAPAAQTKPAGKASGTDPQLLAKGKELYAKNLCVTCHGENLQGGIGNPLAGEKSEAFISQKYVEDFVSAVLAHKNNLPELAKVQQKFNEGEWKNRKKPLTMVTTMGATLAASTLTKDEISAIAAYIASERAKAGGKNTK
jgi:cytochrome c553